MTDHGAIEAQIRNHDALAWYHAERAAVLQAVLDRIVARASA